MRLHKDAKVDLLKGVPLFSKLDKKGLEDVAQIADEIDLPAGKEMATEGDRGREFFVIISGEVEVRRKGRKVATLGPGTYFGEIALLSHKPRTATVTAVTPLRLLVIADRQFVDLLDTMPELWLKVARSLAERITADDLSN